MRTGDIRQWHFAHYPNHDPTMICGESDEHYEAKIEFSQYLSKWILVNYCISCEEAISKKRINKEKYYTIVEQPIYDAKNKLKYRLDVGINDTKKLIAVVEIWHTNKSTPEKIKYLNSLTNNKVFEVKATEVLQAIETKDFTITNHCHQEECVSCLKTTQNNIDKTKNKNVVHDEPHKYTNSYPNTSFDKNDKMDSQASQFDKQLRDSQEIQYDIQLKDKQIHNPKDYRPCVSCKKWKLKDDMNERDSDGKYLFEYICSSCTVECVGCGDSITIIQENKYKRCYHCNMRGKTAYEELLPYDRIPSMRGDELFVVEKVKNKSLPKYWHRLSHKQQNDFNDRASLIFPIRRPRSRLALFESSYDMLQHISDWYNNKKVIELLKRLKYQRSRAKRNIVIVTAKLRCIIRIQLPIFLKRRRTTAKIILILQSIIKFYCVLINFRKKIERLAIANRKQLVEEFLLKEKEKIAHEIAENNRVEHELWLKKSAHKRKRSEISLQPTPSDLLEPFMEIEE